MIISNPSVLGILMNLNDLWFSPIICAQIPLILKTKHFSKLVLHHGGRPGVFVTSPHVPGTELVVRSLILVQIRKFSCRECQ